jgi:hypothetical protein
MLSGTVMATGLAGLNPLGWPATTYGQLLIVKLAIVAAMGVLGAWHRLHHARPVTSAKRSLASEAALGIVALLVTGFLAAASPGAVATPKAEAAAVRAPITLEGTAGPYNITLHITPGPAPGAISAWILRIIDVQANQGVGNAIVDLQLHAPDAAEPLQVPLKQQGLAWVAQGSFIPSPSHWSIRLHFSTPQFADLEARFAVHVS